MLWFILVLILVPAIEITLFILLGNAIGYLSMFMVIIATGILGYFFVKKEGAQTWYKFQQSLASGRPPGDELLSIICIFLGGALLILPGLLTDVIGFFLVLPWTRKPFKLLMLYIISKMIAKRGTIVYRRR